MPRGTPGTRQDEEGIPAGRAVGGPRDARRRVELDEELRVALLPWLDVDELGADGFRSWLLSVLPLLPRPSAGDRVIDRDVSQATPKERLAGLAQALSDCASDRARAHFQASEYFRENRVLARRVKALEAIVRTRAEAEGAGSTDPSEPESEAAVRRYLPGDDR